MARQSKISKLPSSIREDLNQRLDRADTARSIIEWLNAVPEVQELLKLHSKGEPVSEQNITNWRRSGFAAWQFRGEFLDRLQDLSDEKTDLASAAENMADHAARLLSIHFAMLLSPSLSPGLLSKRFDSPSSSSSSSKTSRTRPKPTPPTESTPSTFLAPIIDHPFAIFLINLTRAVVSLRRSDHQAARLKLLLDKSRPQNPNTKKQPTSEQESLAREIAAIRSRRPVIEPAPPLPDSHTPKPPAERSEPGEHLPDSQTPSNINQDISRNPRAASSAASAATPPAPAAAPFPPREDFDLAAHFVAWMFKTQALQTVRERYAGREQYLPWDVQAALKKPASTAPSGTTVWGCGDI